MNSDTIAAIASALAPSGIGIIRVSGTDAFSVVDQIYASPNPDKSLCACQSHTIHYGWIMDQGEKIDEVLVMLMRGPHSYTGEDCVEIDCHGGIYVMRKILEAVVAHGARPADPGEFTKRAFLNGRIDVTQAESVLDVISSQNAFALKSSLDQLVGRLRDAITSMRKKVLHEIAFIESALDDPEHFSLADYPGILRGYLGDWSEEVQSLLAHSEEGRILKEGIRTVIVGKPNAGKSSLLNLLLGTDRAIVTDIAGTTRDVLEEQILLDGMLLQVIDTACIRKTEDIVEKIGVDHAKTCAGKADLILYVVDASLPLDENDDKIMELIRGKRAIILFNKSDLSTVISEEDFRARFAKEEPRIISFSAKNEKGLDALKEEIRSLFRSGEVAQNDQIYISNVRQKTALRETLEDFSLVRKSIDDGMPEDFYSIDLMHAYEALGRIIGEEIGDDLVEEIFSKFCMGK